MIGRLSSAWLSARLALLAALTILLSFSTQGAILAKCGLSLQSDAYFSAIVVPQILFDVFGTALTSVLVPTLVGLGFEDRRQLTWTYLHLVAGVLTGLYAVLICLAPAWTYVLFPGFSLEARTLTIALVHVCLISMLFSGMSMTIACYCRSRRRFVYPEVCATLGALAGLVALLVLFPIHGIVAAAIGVVIRSAVELLLLLPCAGRYRLPQFFSPTIYSSVLRMKPLLLSSSYQKTDMLIDRMLTSLAPPGSISVLAFTRQVFHAVARLMNKAIAATMLQSLSAKFKQKDAAGYWKTWRRSVLAMFVLSFVCLCSVVAFGDIVLAQFLRSESSAAIDAHRIWVMFLALGGVIIGEPLVHAASNAFYAFQDTKTPARVSVVAYTLGTALRVAGFAAFGVLGIGIALSGYYLLYAAILLFALRRAAGVQKLFGMDDKGQRKLNEQPVLRKEESMRILSVIPGVEEHQKSMPFVRRQIESIQAAGIEVQPFFLRSRTSPLVIIQDFLRFRRIVRQFDPHLVHAQFGTVTGLFTALATWRPSIMSCRGSDLNPAPGVSRVRNRLGHLMSQLATLRMRRIVCVSQQLVNRLWWRVSCSEVIPDGVNFELFQPASRSVAREKLRLDPLQPIVLFNARTDPVGKRLDLAEAAVEIARRKYPDIYLCVLRGEVPLREMSLYYNAADCFLMASDNEGSPNVVKEALACSLPVVSVDVGDVRERLRGVFPSYLSERDPEALAQSLIQVLEQNQRSNGRAIVAELEENNIAQRVIETYRKVLHRAA